MTEAEWLACDDPTPMVEFVQGKANDRKLRLFACACGRSIWNYYTDERLKTAIAVAEAFADGRATKAELAVAQLAAEAASHAMSEGSASAAAFLAWEVALEEIPLHGLGIPFGAACVLDPFVNPTGEGEVFRDIRAAHIPFYRAQAHTLRCIFGNPFRPVSFDPSWRTSTAVSLAQGMYDSREFSAMPILADALQDAGCEHADILTHCRDEKATHVRGCWVVDLVLGKM